MTLRGCAQFVGTLQAGQPNIVGELTTCIQPGRTNKRPELAVCMQLLVKVRDADNCCLAFDPFRPCLFRVTF
jgi:hypothetical protein